MGTIRYLIFYHFFGCFCTCPIECFATGFIHDGWIWKMSGCYKDSGGMEDNIVNWQYIKTTLCALRMHVRPLLQHFINYVCMILHCNYNYCETYKMSPKFALKLCSLAIEDWTPSFWKKKCFKRVWKQNFISKKKKSA